MNKKLYFGLLLILLVFTLSGCGSKKTAEKAVNPEANVPEVNSEEEEFTASALEMMGKGKSLHCTFSFEDTKEGTKQTGEFYVDGQNKKFRSEAEMVVNTTTVIVKSISDGQYAYSWNNLVKPGFKIKLDQAATAKVEGEQKTQDMNQAVKFKCRSWKVDNSLFELPAGIEFTDMAELLKQTTAPNSPGGIDLCAICNQIPDLSQRSTCQKTNCK